MGNGNENRKKGETCIDIGMEIGNKNGEEVEFALVLKQRKASEKEEEFALILGWR